MVLMDEPAHVGCLLDVRLIGVIEAEQVKKGRAAKNDRLIGVAMHSYNHRRVRSLNEIDQTLLDQVEEFFVSYNHSRGKKFKVKGRHGPKRAAELVSAGVKRFRNSK